MCWASPAGDDHHGDALDPSLVVDPTSRALATGVTDYFDRSRHDRETLATQARDRGRTFDDVTRCEAFQRAFGDIVTRL